jgi:4-hydroxy-3-methylbut-2-enyl diphosphate reductase
LIEDEESIRPEWLDGVESVGVTAGASAPEVLVERITRRLRDLGFDRVRELELMAEDVRFMLPAELAAHLA